MHEKFNARFSRYLKESKLKSTANKNGPTKTDNVQQEENDADIEEQDYADVEENDESNAVEWEQRLTGLTEAVFEQLTISI